MLEGFLGRNRLDAECPREQFNEAKEQSRREENQSHAIYDDHWADNHIHDVIALDEDQEPGEFTNRHNYFRIPLLKKDGSK